MLQQLKKQWRNKKKKVPAWNYLPQTPTFGKCQSLVKNPPQSSLFHHCNYQLNCIGLVLFKAQSQSKRITYSPLTVQGTGFRSIPASTDVRQPPPPFYDSPGSHHTLAGLLIIMLHVRNQISGETRACDRKGVTRLFFGTIFPPTSLAPNLPHTLSFPVCLIDVLRGKEGHDGWSNYRMDSLPRVEVGERGVTWTQFFDKQHRKRHLQAPIVCCLSVLIE